MIGFNSAKEWFNTDFVTKVMLAKVPFPDRYTVLITGFYGASTTSFLKMLGSSGVGIVTRVRVLDDCTSLLVQFLYSISAERYIKNEQKASWKAAWAVPRVDP